MFEKVLVDHLLEVVRPHLRDVVEEVLAQKSANEPICVEYEEAGRMLGTTYEGIRKMVSKGKLKCVERGRRRCIAVEELKSYVRRNTKEAE